MQNFKNQFYKKLRKNHRKKILKEKRRRFLDEDFENLVKNESDERKTKKSSEMIFGDLTNTLLTNNTNKEYDSTDSSGSDPSEQRLTNLGEIKKSKNKRCDLIENPQHSIQLKNQLNEMINHLSNLPDICNLETLFNDLGIS